MAIFKERYGNLRMCGISTDDYETSLAKINRLVWEIRQDFPTVKDTDIKIVLRDGSSRHGQMIVEFYLPDGVEIPADYVKLQSSPQLLG